MAQPPQIVVLGAGSVGCFVGGAWAAAGLDVSFVRRERIAAEVAANGMTLSDLDGWTARLPAEAVAYSARPAALARADIVLVTVKSNDTEAAARQIAAHARRKPVVISLQNGVSNPEVLKARLPKLEIVQGVVPFNIVRQGAGRWHKSVAGRVILGDTGVTRALKDRIASGPAQIDLAADIKAVAWGKLLINLNNAVNALSGRTLLDQLKERDYRRIVAASILEALEILKAAGIEPAQLGPVPPKLLPHAIGAPDFIFCKLLLPVQRIDAAARSSMQDDLEAGRPTEIDYLNGEVVRLAESLGRDATVNRKIVDLIHARELGVEHDWTPRQLWRNVLEGHRRVAFLGY